MPTQQDTAMADGLRVAIGDSWQPKALTYFAMVMMALMIITNVLNLKFIDFFGISIIGSQLPYVISLILADILSEVYGYRRVRRLLYVGLGCLILYAGFVQLVVMLPSAHGYPNSNAFSATFAQTPRIIVASISAYFVTELANSFVMSKLKVRFVAKYFYLRALCAVGAAQLINGITFFLIGFGGVLSPQIIASAAAFSWAMVMTCELVVLPLTKRIAFWVKRYEGVEHFDAAPDLEAQHVRQG
jgi:uncharacterized integral membrane protein (TIGR00697 family)